MAEAYHVSVMLDECVGALNIRPDGVYVDGTFGAGGHSAEILKSLNVSGKLFGFDQDSDARRNMIDQSNFEFVASNFRYLGEYMRYYEVEKLDGILLDLGVSSFQFDTAERGFSYRFDSPLDMRMGDSMKFSAADVLNTYSAAQLQAIFSDYAELRNAKTLAHAIVNARNETAFDRSGEFNDFLRKWMRGDEQKYFSQVYQALRIEVNDEFGALRDCLMAARDLLAVGGRLVVLTFHSLEDRIVKRFFQNGTFSNQAIKDDFGVIERPFKYLKKKFTLPSEQELVRNSRSRSAKMRVVEKI